MHNVFVSIFLVVYFSLSITSFVLYRKKKNGTASFVAALVVAMFYIGLGIAAQG